MYACMQVNNVTGLTNIHTLTVIADCGPLDAPENGSVMQPDTTEGGVTTFSCQAGFDLIGNATRVCQSTAAWTGMQPTCQST